MEKAIKNFLRNDQAPVELLAHLKLTIPTIDLNQAIGESISRAEVSKLLNIIPAQGLEIDIGATWENDVSHYMQAMITSKTLISLLIKNCNDEVKFLPPNLQELDLEGKSKKQLIGYAASYENLQKLRLKNGMISSELFLAIQRRHRPLEYLELEGVDIWLNDVDDIVKAMKNVSEVKASGLKWLGSPMDGEMLTEAFGIRNTNNDN